MSLGRRIVRENEVLLQDLFLDVLGDWVADDERIVQPERREPVFRWIAPFLEAVARAEELQGLVRIDSPLLGRRFGVGIVGLGLKIALGDARAGRRRLRGMARGFRSR